MKVLMVTPIVDERDSILGFIPSWINHLAQKVDKLNVVTLGYNENTHLLKNVTVHSLDKVAGKLGKILYFNNTMFRLLHEEADAMFCHMYPSLAIRAAPYAKLLGIPVVWWRTHGSVSLTARIVHFLADKVVTASKESFRIKSHKVIITGHGIDTDRFKPAENFTGKNKNKTILLYVGRISPRKHIETLIKAAAILVNKQGMRDLVLVIVGGVPVTSQEPLLEELKIMVNELELGNYVEFVGAVPYSNVVDYYQQCDLFITGSQTGSIDKNVLEAMACEKPAIACNEAFEDVFGVYSKLLMFNKEDPYDLAHKIVSILEMDKDQHDKLCTSMRETVEHEHNIDNLTVTLVEVFKSCRR
ncbi:glycosyltransferase family 4 protein [Chloroflexota bacterium]